MKRFTRPLMLAALVLAGAAGAQSAPALVLQPGAKISIDGTSTVRKFTCWADSMNARLEPGEGGSLALAQLSGAVRSLDLAIPATKLKCGDGTMEDHMYSALKAKQFPIIRFQMTGYEVGARAGDKVPVTLKGDLTLSGQKHPVTLVLSGTEGANGTLQLEGKHELKMTEWGVQPPTLMFGAIKVGDTVQLTFKLAVKQQAAAPQAAAAPQG